MRAKRTPSGKQCPSIGSEAQRMPHQMADLEAFAMGSEKTIDARSPFIYRS